MYIEMMNPGYNKFVADSAFILETANHTAGSVQGTLPFTRRLAVEGSVFEKSYKHRKSLSAETDGFRHMRPNIDFRRISDLSLSSRSSSTYAQHNASTGSEQKQSKSRGYTFTSPWNGRCEFSAGVGQTLKCRHSISNQYLALTAEPQVVSELRFNLPGGGPLASSRTEDQERDSYAAPKDRDCLDGGNFPSIRYSLRATRVKGSIYRLAKSAPAVGLEESKPSWAS